MFRNAWEFAKYVLGKGGEIYRNKCFFERFLTRRHINMLESNNFFIDMPSCLDKLSWHVTDPCNRFISDPARVEEEEEIRRLKKFFLNIIEKTLKEEELYYLFPKLFISLELFYSTYNAAVYLFDIIMNMQTGSTNDSEGNVEIHFRHTLRILENYINLLTYYFPVVLFILFDEKHRNCLEEITNKLTEVFKESCSMHHGAKIFFCTLPLNFALLPLQVKGKAFGPLYRKLKEIKEKHPLLNFLASPLIRNSKGAYHVIGRLHRVEKVDSDLRFVGVDERLFDILKKDLLIDHKRWLELELILKLIDNGVFFINNVFFTFKNGTQGEVDVLAVDLRKDENIIIYECKQEGEARFSGKQRKSLKRLANYLRESYVDVELKVYPEN